MQYIFFDTNIYRQLGVNYSEKIDYVNIRNLQGKGPNEFMILDVVEKELLDYFENDIISPLIGNYEKLYLSFESNPFLPNIPLIELTKTEQEARKKFKEQLKQLHYETYSADHIDTKEIVDFSIINKRESRKDNTRDFIILLNLIDIAKANPDDTVVFISNDRIFSDNKYFTRVIKQKNISNILFIESIAGYMHKFGFQIDFINKSKVLDSISIDALKEELYTEIDCLPSYVSEFYHSNNDIPEIEKCEFFDLQLYEYYTYPDEKDKIKIITTVKVRVRAVYQFERNADLRNILREKYYESDRSHIDSNNRPIYDNYILFIIEGEVDQENKQILNQVVVDFLPNWNVQE